MEQELEIEDKTEGVNFHLGESEMNDDQFNNFCQLPLDSTAYYVIMEI